MFRGFGPVERSATPFEFLIRVFIVLRFVKKKRKKKYSEIRFVRTSTVIPRARLLACVRVNSLHVAEGVRAGYRKIYIPDADNALKTPDPETSRIGVFGSRNRNSSLSASRSEILPKNRIRMTPW